MSNTVIESRQVYVVRNGNSVKVISAPNRTHEISLNTTLINTTSSVTDEEHALIERLVDGLVDGIEDRAELTQGEIDTLDTLQSKTSTYTVKEIVGEKETVDHAKNTVNLIHEHILNGQEKKAQVILNKTERRIISLQKTIDIYSEDFWQVEYDIPEKVKKTKNNPKGVVNPSEWFWDHAMRLTKSCWVFPVSSFTHQEVSEWLNDAKKKGCDIITIKYAADQIATIKDRAANQLRKAMIEYHTGLIRNIEKADKRLQDAIDEINNKVVEGTTSSLTASRQERERVDYRNNQVKNHIINAAERLETAIRSAEMFDLTENIRDLFDAYHATLESTTETFNAVARARNITGVNLKKILKSVE